MKSLFPNPRAVKSRLSRMQTPQIKLGPPCTSSTERLKNLASTFSTHLSPCGSDFFQESTANLAIAVHEHQSIMNRSIQT